MSPPAAGNVSCATPPFVPFFALAALDAILGVGAWLPTLAGLDPPLAPLANLVGWHAREMLCGYVPAVLSGFLLTALPRWTRRDIPAWCVRLILLLWLASRIAPAQPNPFALMAAAPSLALTLVAFVRVARGNDRRNAKTVALLGLYAGACVCLAGPVSSSMREFAIRLALAAIIGLIMIIGGRVVPALTTRFHELCGEAPPPPAARTIESFASLSAAAGLISWLTLNVGNALAIALGCAALGQILRMAGWFGRRTASTPPLRALYLSYASLPAGFALLAIHALAPERIPESAGLHVWLTGGLGGMTLAIMSSMIRKRNNLAFATSTAGHTTILLWLVATLCRVAGALAASPTDWLIAAACAWAAAFSLFLFDFSAPLLGRILTRSPKARRRRGRTESHW